MGGMGYIHTYLSYKAIRRIMEISPSVGGRINSAWESGPSVKRGDICTGS